RPPTPTLFPYTTLFRSDLPDADDGIDASGVLSDGTILFGAVSYTWEGERYSTKGWKASAYVLASKDDGATWSPPVPVDAAPFARSEEHTSELQSRFDLV